MIALSSGLAIVVVAAKLVLLPFPVSSIGEFVRWMLRLAIISSADLLFVAALALVCLLMCRAVATRPRLARYWRTGMVVVFQAAGLYAVASVAMFRLTMVPLTVEILSFAGGPMLMASSIGGLLSVATILASLGAVILLFGCVRFLDRSRWRVMSFLVHRRALFAAIVLIVAYAGMCRAYVQANWTDVNRWERRIAVSPHAVLLASCVGELIKSDHLTLSFDPQDADESDFQRPAALDPSAKAEAVQFKLPEGSARPKNLIVVVMESVGVEYLSLYGAQYDTTPQLARLVEQGGLVFDQVYCHAPSSPKGLVAISASVIPRIDWKLITRDSPDFNVPTLADVLHAQGYRTAYLHSGYWSWKNRDEFLRRRGVDAVMDADNLSAEKVFSWGVSDDDMFDAALRWIDEDPDRPFHLLMWTIETHHPYRVAGDPIRFGSSDEELERYLNSVRAADARIAQLVKELERRNLADSTLIAVTGDHGEAFGQHQQRVHSFGIYEENVHVPLVLLSPRLGNLPRRYPGVCQQIDIAPTLLGILGVVPPVDWQGRNVLADGGSPRAYFFSVGHEVLLGVRDARFKYHYRVSSRQEELFDLEADPNELTNIAAGRPELANEYRRRVSGLVTFQRRFLAEHGSP